MADKKVAAPGVRTGGQAAPQSAEDRFALASQNRIAAELYLDKLEYSAEPGSKYQKALAAYKKAQAEEQTASAAVDAERGQKKKVKATAKVSDLQTERQRLIDKGVSENDQRIKEIDDKIKAAGGEGFKFVPAAETTAPSAVKPKPGVLPPAGQRKPSAAAEPTPTPSPATGEDAGGFKYIAGNAPASPASPTPQKPNAPSPTGDKKIDKTAWVSWMRQTFKTLDDTNERSIINGLLQTAKKQNWTEKQFLDSLDQQSAWWRNQLPTLKQFFLDSNDPRNRGTFNQRVMNNIDSVTSSLEKLGVDINRIDPITGKGITQQQYDDAVKGIALEAMKNGWTADQIQNHIAQKVDVIFSGGGVIGSSSSRVKSWADKFGINISDSYMADINRSILDPLDGRDEQWWYNEMQRKAIDNYAPFASGFAQGRTLADMTSNYRDTMANLLEVDPMSISWKDLMGYAVSTDDKGNQVKTTMSDFVKKVKQNPMWQTTRNAKETYTSMGMDLLKEFGIVG